MPLEETGEERIMEARLLGVIDKTQDLWARWPAGRRGRWYSEEVQDKPP